MKIRDITNLIDAISDLASEVEDGETQSPGTLTPVEPAQTSAPCDSEPNNDDHNDEIMVPPLQQKHELLKKATGVENNTDQFAADIETDGDDEMDNMRKLAGIKGPDGVDYNASQLIIAADDSAEVD